MKIEPNWQRKTTIIFAVTILLLSILLTIFAIRAAERERLVMEREIEEEQQRLAELILGQVKAIISELEGRINRLLRSYQTQSHEKVARNEAITEVCKRIAEGEEIVKEVFLVNEKGEVFFPLIKPLFILPDSFALDSLEPRFTGSRESGHLLVETLTSTRQTTEGQNIREKPVEIEVGHLFERAEISEFKTRDYPMAIESYQKLLDATSDNVYRAIFVNRIGRCYKKSGEYLKAIETYQKILKEYKDEVSFDGIPLEIIAQYQIGSIYSKIGRKTEGTEAFLELYNDLFKSKWSLSKSQFYFYLREVKAMLKTSIVDEMSDGKKLMKKWDELQRLEEEKLDRMDTIENLRQKVIPLIKAKRTAYSTDSGRFYHVSEIIGKEFYLVSYTPVGDNKVLGISIDSEVLTRKLLPLKLSMLPLRKGWHIQITDKFGSKVAGEEITNLKGAAPQLTFSKDFEEDFPSWKVLLYQSDIGLPERLFNLKRNIYILSVAVVISAILFGGCWAIKSIAKELKLSKLKSEFVSTVSHELRTPLTSIRYLAELLQRGRVQEEGRKQQYYETITNESERLGRLIENILDFSKIEARMKEYRFEDTDIAELAGDVVSRFQEQVAQKGFIIESEISNHLPKVSADREAISQALFNLLDNALKYSGESSKAFISIWSDANSVFLEVRDEGIGISKEEQKKVFEKFYRSKYLQDSSIKGSGIGLTLVAHIVKAHGGETILESDLGKGTKVTMKIPLRRKSRLSGAHKAQCC